MILLVLQRSKFVTTYNRIYPEFRISATADNYSLFSRESIWQYTFESKKADIAKAATIITTTITNVDKKRNRIKHKYCMFAFYNVNG